MNYLNHDIITMVLAASVGTLVLLQAQTGSGKSTMILSNLWPNAIMDHRPLLWVVNRTTLKSQAIYDVLKINGVNPSETDLSVDGYIAINGLVIMSYQYLAKRLETANADAKIGPYIARSYRYIVFDEAHYLIADSRFNAMNSFFINIPRVFIGSARIYMSATLEPARDLIYKIEGVTPIEKVYEYPEWHPYDFVDLRFFPLTRDRKWVERKVLELKTPASDYGYLIIEEIPAEVEKQMELISEMIKSGTINKLLWFIDSIKDGEHIAEYLEQHKISSALLFAADGINKSLNEVSTTTLEEIRTLSKFSVSVLLTTEVLDNGINIKDPEVTHLLTSGTEQISVLQQIGRVRMLTEEQRLTVLIPERTKQFFARQQYLCNQKLRAFDDFKTADTDKIIKMGLAGSLTEIEKCLYRTDQTHGHFFLSPLAVISYRYYKEAYRIMLAKMQIDEKAWLKQIYLWLEKSFDPVEEAERVEKNNSMNELRGLLASISPKSLSDEAYDTLRQQITTYIQTIHGVDLTHGHPRLPGARSINRYLVKYGYEIIPDGTRHYQLRKIR